MSAAIVSNTGAIFQQFSFDGFASHFHCSLFNQRLLTLAFDIPCIDAMEKIQLKRIRLACLNCRLNLTTAKLSSAFDVAIALILTLTLAAKKSDVLENDLRLHFM